MVFIGIGLVLLVVELLLGTFYLLVLSVAFACGGVFYSVGNVSFSMTLVIIGILSLIGIVVVYRYQQYLKTRKVFPDDYDVGQSVIIKKALGGELWEVSYKGINWQAKLVDESLALPIEAVIGKHGTIINKQSNILMIRVG